MRGEGRGEGLLTTATSISKSRYRPLMDARRGLFEDFAIATAVLTRLPVGVETPGEHGAIAAAGWAFPLVGAGIGALAALAFLFAQLLGCGIPVAALIALLAGLAGTGAFHEDGLADTADGVGRGHDPPAKPPNMPASHP